MPNMPRGIVLSAKWDGKAFAAALDKILVGFTSAKIDFKLINTATVERDEKTWLLFPMLDKGTKPHDIGEADDLMGDAFKPFGPVWGGMIWHPGTRPFKISAQVVAFLEETMAKRLRFPFLSLAGLSAKKGADMPWVNFRLVLAKIAQDTENYARNITPDAWSKVKYAYKVVLTGRGMSGYERPE